MADAETLEMNAPGGLIALSPLDAVFYAAENAEDALSGRYGAGVFNNGHHYAAIAARAAFRAVPALRGE